MSGRITIELSAAVIILFPLLFLWFTFGVGANTSQLIKSPVVHCEFKSVRAIMQKDSGFYKNGTIHYLKLVSGRGIEAREGTVAGEIKIYSKGGVELYSWGQKVVFTPTEPLSGVMFVSGDQLYEAGWVSPFFRIRGIANKLFQYRLITVDPSGLLSTVLLGKTASVAIMYKELIRKCGASHLLALSGFHLGIFLTILRSAAGKYKKRHWCKAGVIIIGWLYHLLVGPLASLTRAAATVTVLLLYTGRFRMWKLRRAVTTGSIAVMLINPSIVTDPGFRLSFFALYGIIVFSPWVTIKMPRILPVSIHTSIAVSLGAQIGALGISTTLFSTLPVFSFIYILFLTPIISVYAFLGIAALVIPAVSGLLMLLRAVFSRILMTGEYNVILTVSNNVTFIGWILIGAFLIYSQLRTIRIYDANRL